MYIEQLYDLVDELGLKKDEVNEMKLIVRRAGYQYLLNKWQNKLSKNLEFNMDGWYIKQSEILSRLGILVYPKSWEKRHTDYSDSNPFGPSDSVTWTTTECNTLVIFPTRLFTQDEKEDVLKSAKIKKI